MAKKPAWVIEKERAGRTAELATFWLFGLHAVRDALRNPAREKLRLVATRNAAEKLTDAIAASGLTPEIVDPRKIPPVLEPGSVHQGALLEVRALKWGTVETLLVPHGRDRLLLLDRVSDPHNVGAILRSAEVFGARAVIAPARHSAPETGALAKAASGALERQPYLRVGNLGNAMEQLHGLGYTCIGLAGESDMALEDLPPAVLEGPMALVLGAEGPGLRERTRALCQFLVKIPALGEFGSLNVSNAAAVALYAIAGRGRI